jgi:two-component system, NarL family, nitrate/nitrite response regulator NarL
VTDRIAIVEDHGLLAATVAAALGAVGKDVEVLRPGPGDDLIDRVVDADPDVVLLDLDLGTWGDATEHVGPLNEAGVTVVMVTGVTDPVRRAACVAGGAVGVIDKSDGFDVLLEAIDTVQEHGTLLSEHERQEHLALLREHEHRRAVRLGPFESLSGREAEVLGELMAGHTVDQIAASAFVSVATVRTQVRSILAKLQVSSQVAAIGRAREAGWVPPQERDRHA